VFPDTPRGPAAALTAPRAPADNAKLFLAPMKLALAQVPPEGCEVQFTAGEALLRDAGEGIRPGGAVEVEGRAGHEGTGLRVVGEVRTRLRLTCSRCLEDFDFSVDSRFDVTYSKVVPVEDEVELDGRELTVCHLEGDTVDLGELAREQVLLEVPMAPLCTPGCKGLCPRCGANRNLEPCGCPPAAADPRFQALGKLFN
jgi:uncharacterized protein